MLEFGQRSGGLSMQIAKMLVLTVIAATMIGASARTDAPPEAKVYFISPANGATVDNPMTVRFGLRNIGVAPAGVELPKTGHHHLLIDVEELPNTQFPVPADDRHRHFGGGQTEVELELEPGEHSLQLILGDHLHIPHDPPIVSEKITITVTAPK